MATFVRTWAKGNDAGADLEDITKLGGLFGSIDRNGTRYIIRWRRPEQAAFLILCWNAIQSATAASRASWKLALAENAGKSKTLLQLTRLLVPTPSWPLTRASAQSASRTTP